MNKIDFAALRDGMVDRQVAGRGVRSPLVLDAMRTVPREAFLPEPLREFAYEDAPLPIAENQTMAGETKPLVLITGAAGEIGSALAEVLAHDYTLVGLDRAGKSESVPTVPQWLSSLLPQSGHCISNIRKHRIRILAGDRVTLKMSRYDLTKGRIFFRHKDERAAPPPRPAQFKQR